MICLSPETSAVASLSRLWHCGSEAGRPDFSQSLLVSASRRIGMSEGTGAAASARHGEGERHMWEAGVGSVPREAQRWSASAADCPADKLDRHGSVGIGRRWSLDFTTCRTRPGRVWSDRVFFLSSLSRPYSLSNLMSVCLSVLPHLGITCPSTLSRARPSCPVCPSFPVSPRPHLSHLPILSRPSCLVPNVSAAHPILTMPPSPVSPVHGLFSGRLKPCRLGHQRR